jgi:hypothetical protein
MKSIITLFAAAGLLMFTACEKDSGCYDTVISGIYFNVDGTFTPPGQTSTQSLPASEKTVSVTSTACNAVNIFIGASIGSFNATCTKSGDIISGANADNTSTFSFNEKNDEMTIKFTASSGIVYNVTAK